VRKGVEKSGLGAREREEGQDEWGRGGEGRRKQTNLDLCADRIIVSGQTGFFC